MMLFGQAVWYRGGRRAGLSRRITRLMAGEKKQGWLVWSSTESGAMP